uniref:Uncharacterized protein n=1 Tax=Tanacetum cinerariifolium TaxID=118510 RepID=A0A6L2KD81_TANCI|nr:hypothetical protein [Tanacetum cinerariifolium]
MFSNPPDDEKTMQNLFTWQTEILNRQVQMRDEHQSGLRSIGKGIKNLWKGKKKNTPSPQPTNHFLDDPLAAPPRPSNLLPFQSHPPLDITLHLSPITYLDHTFESLLSSPESPLSPPPLPSPQPSLMGHPIFFSVLDYHRAHCLRYFHN